jgi:hypothetical protein
MALHLVTTRETYAAPQFQPPPASGYLLVGASVAPPVGPPLVRPDKRRVDLLARVKGLGGELSRSADVERVTVFRAVLIPPSGTGAPGHPARFDVVALVETTDPGAIDAVRHGSAFSELTGVLAAAAKDTSVIAATCVRSLGDVDATRPGLFLFNFFAGADADTALALWERLAAWYVAKTGLDNSTLLAPLEPADYVLVNHARWDMSAPRLALEQFLRPSFHRYVRGNLRANKVTAMPALYRLA